MKAKTENDASIKEGSKEEMLFTVEDGSGVAAAAAAAAGSCEKESVLSGLSQPCRPLRQLPTECGKNTRHHTGSRN